MATEAPRLSKKAARELRERIARAYPFVPCEQCSSGWVLKVGWYPHMVRCACWHAHQAKIQRLLGGQEAV